MKKLIVALDVTKREEALKIAEEVSEYIDEIKVGYPLVLLAGIDIIAELSEIKPVIADFKIADIPYTSARIADIAFKSGAKSVIAHGFVGRDSLLAIQKVASRYSGSVYVVVELSSDGGKEFMSKISGDIVKMAEEVGCKGLIAPATRIEKLVEIRKSTNLEILCPGIGAQGGSLEAIKYCDGIIVGRSIYESKNPKKVAMNFRSVLDEV